MDGAKPDIRAIFCEALDRQSPEELTQYLDTACGGNADLRAQIEELLASHREAGKFLGGASAKTSEAINHSMTEKPGMVIGPYKLRQVIGEGGMGTVYMAEQTEPVERKVALKVIKAGMDTQQVIARFEAERQALAMMDHVNIARVLDVGTTQSGRPYFVMELVHGVPITKYCDDNQLTPRQRLELFVPVCQAIQHAHQKGIIHRDIKPSNVMVTLYDGKPVPKVIDFGVAKATEQKLTERTLFTQYGTMVGTLEYMSPEQAEMSALGVDTRSDIYSLGVLLYELLTGNTPLTHKRMKEGVYAEILRMIKEEEPPKPSTRLSDSGEALASISANRHTEPAKLTKLVRGELDWIVMKTLEKDRNRRYETANGFAMDVQRYLADEHVLACPPSAAYRLRKFVRRNKGALATTAIVAAALVLGTVVSVWQAVRATNALQAEKKARRDAELARDGEKKQRGVAQQQTSLAQQQTTLAQKNATEAEGQRQRAEANFGKARKAVEEYLTKITENELLRVPGLQPLREDLLKAALKFYAEFTQERAGDPTLRQELASAHLLLARIQRELDNKKAAQAANLESIRLYEQLRADEQRAPAATRVGVQAGLAAAYFFAGRYDDTVTLCEAILKVDPKHAEVRSLLSDTHNQLGNDHDKKPDIAAALARHRLAFELREGLVRDFPEDPRYLAQLSGTVNNLANLLVKQNRLEEGLAMYERAAGYATQAYQLAPHSILWSKWLCIQLRNTGNTQARLGRQEDALRSYERVVSVSRKRVFENPAIGEVRGDLYQAYVGLGKYQKQVGDAAGSSRNFHLAREVLEQIPRETPDQLFDLARVYSMLSASPADVADPTASDAAERQQHADLAVATLKKAIDAGYQDVRKELQTSKDLNPLRERQDFQEILAASQKIAEANQRLAQANSPDAAIRLANSKQAAELLQGLAAGQSRHRTTLAATLHSIGMIQTGLKQFAEAEQSLTQALQLRQELLREPAGSPQARVDVLATRAAIGQLYWESDRPEEAHRLWQEILAECRQAAADQAQDAALYAGHSGVVWSIAQKYGEAGLWELALPPLEQGLQSQQLVDVAWDCRGAHVLAALGRLEEHRKFCQLLAARWGKNNAPHVVWAATMNPQPAVEIKRLLELADTVIKNSTDPMANFQAATAYYHAGQYQRALELMLPFREKISTGGSAYQHWLALVYHKLGQKEEAARYFEQAEARYLFFADKCLKSPAKSAAHTGHGNYWWAWAEDQAARQLAWNELRGPGKLRDPWQHLISARGYRLIGELEKYEVELAAAEARAPSDSEFWIARARLAEQLAEQDRVAEAAWQRAIEAASDKPLPWIHRGRWYAQRCEQAKADADFAKAASLTPNELNKFLEAGWWVSGPYPPELKEFCPPEIAADPSRPVYIVDPKTGLSDIPVAWSSVPTADFGRIDLASFRAASGSASFYALTHVYSPRETTATLCISATKDARFWVNGELVYDYSAATTPRYWSRDPDRFPVVLRAGPNTILVKSAADSALTIRLGDHPYDRGMELARYGQWKEAADLLEQGLQRSTEVYVHSDPFKNLATFRLAAGDVAAVRKLYAELKGQVGTVPAWRRVLTQIGGMAPGIVDDPGELVELAMGLRSSDNKQIRILIPLAYYRAGRWQEVVDFFARDDECRTTLAEASRLLSMAHYRLGNLAEAESWHAQTIRNNQAGQVERAARWPSGSPWLNLLLPSEASRLIAGGAAAVETPFEEFYRRRRADREKFPPELLDFDAALYINPRLPQLYLSRGKRLAELGRFDKAQADFNKALELNAKNPDVLAARAIYFADRGEPAKAAADFHAALNLFDDAGSKPRWFWGVPIDLEVAQRDDVFDRLSALRPQDPRPLMTRMVLRLQQLDVEAARSDAQRLATYGSVLPSWRAAEALLRGDAAEFTRLRTAGAHPSPNFQVMLLGLAPTEGPLTAKIREAAARMWRELPQDRWQRRWLGLAQLRTGQLTEAAASLEASLAPGDRWEQDAFVWPLLAIAHHQLGNAEPARRWLNVTENCLALRAQAGAGGVAAGTGVPGVLPEQWLYAIVFYSEAKALIDGPDAARQGRERLAALSRERNQAALVTADAARQQGLAKVEAAWQRAVELAGDNALPWIQRGRWYAQRGEHEKADADFTKAASLTPNELNKFLEAGWWAIGPYPAELKEFCPPEIVADPSVSVYVVDPQQGFSKTPIPWQSFSTERLGRVDLRSASVRKDNASLYALAYVYTREEQTRLLMTNKSQPLRIWVNGALVEDHTPGEQQAHPHYEQFHRIPVVLRSGRNAILIKSRTADFTVRIGDTPRDRGILLAEQYRFSEAFAARPQEPNADQAGGYLATPLLDLAALLGTGEEYAQTCRLLVRRAEKADPAYRILTARYCAQRANPVFDEHAAALVAYVDDFLSKEQPAWAQSFAALVHFRAGNPQRSLALLEQSTWKPYGLPIQALLAHQAGDNVAARKFLQAALAVATDYEGSRSQQHRAALHGIPPFHWWYDWPGFLTSLREAEQKILGETIQSDALRARSEAKAKAQWAVSSETAAFDQALIYAPLGGAGQPKVPKPYLARGRRLSELGRFAEAEADFNKAVEFTPDDLDALLARASFYAQRGDVERSANDFGAALKLMLPPPHENYAPGLVVGRELARHDAVFAKVAERRPNDYRIWLGRSMHHADHGRWHEAAAENSKADWPRGFFILRTMERACLQHLASDLQGYCETCQELIAEESSAEEQLTFQVRRGILVACGIAPEGNRLAPNLVERAEQLAAAEKDPWVHLGTALALYRAGRFDDARLRCEKAPAPSAWLDLRLALDCLRAMCLHQLGRPAEARALLQAVQACMAPPAAEPNIVLSKNGGPELTFRLVRRVLYEQATQLLSTTNP